MSVVICIYRYDASTVSKNLLPIFQIAAVGNTVAKTVPAVPTVFIPRSELGILGFTVAR